LFENENKDIIKIRHSNPKNISLFFGFDVRVQMYTTDDNKFYIEINGVLPSNNNCIMLGEPWVKCNIFKLTNEYILK
jgi:hypothetical protein